MVVEGDHGRPRLPRFRLANQVLEQVHVSAMHAIEHADHREERPMLGAKPLDPGDDVHQAGAPAPAGASAATSTLSGASRPGPAGIAIATRVPSGPRRR